MTEKIIESSEELLLDTPYDTLQQLHLALFEVEDMAAFMTRLAEVEAA